MPHGGGKKAIIAAFFANLLIALSKFVVFLITGAASLLAESIHSLADTGNQGLLLHGGRAARRAPDEEHPFGFGAARYFWAFVVALVLFSLGGLFAIYEGIDKLAHPHELESAGLAVGLLVFSIAVEAYSLRTAVRETRPMLHGRSYWQFIRHTKNPELPVVLLEDIGAQIGLVFALAGVVLAELTGNPRWDAAGSLAIGALLVAIACILAIEMSSLLLGESAEAHNVSRIRDALATAPHVRTVIHLRTLQQGPEEIITAAKVAFDNDLSVRELAAAIDEAEARVRAAVADARLIFIEPDLLRSESAQPAPDRPEPG